MSAIDYCQNWRADVVAVVDKAALMGEWAKYTSYGIPIGMPGGDTDSDGDCDATDITNVDALISSGYDVRADVDLDGDVDSLDKAILQAYYQGTTLGWGKLSWIGNRKGYAGYELDGCILRIHARSRLLDPSLGRWSSFDPAVYIDGLNLRQYVNSNPLGMRDPFGLACDQGCKADFKVLDSKEVGAGFCNATLTVAVSFLDDGICRTVKTASEPGIKKCIEVFPCFITVNVTAKSDCPFFFATAVGFGSNGANEYTDPATADPNTDFDAESPCDGESVYLHFGMFYTYVATVPDPVTGNLVEFDAFGGIITSIRFICSKCPENQIFAD